MDAASRVRACVSHAAARVCDNTLLALNTRIVRAQLCYTGGGMLDDDELNLLKKVDQIVGGAVVENAGCVLTLADGTKVEYDWAIWCHGYDPEPYAPATRVNECPHAGPRLLTDADVAVAAADVAGTSRCRVRR